MKGPLHSGGLLAGSSGESWSVTIFKALLYGISLLFYLAPLSSFAGILAGVSMAIVGLALASVARGMRLRAPVVLLAASSVGALALAMGGVVLDGQMIPSLLGIRQSFILSDVLTFGLGALAMVLALRYLSLRIRLATLLEVLFVAGAVVALLADHRNRMLNRPRVFSDWIWTMGLDPSTVLVAVGISVTIVAIFLFLRGQTLLKMITTLLLLIALGVGYFLLGAPRIKLDKPSDALGLSGKGKDKDSKGGQGGGQGGGRSKNPFKDNYQNNTPPTPVAVAILRDDFIPRDNLMYFRQTVLSLYNGHHLVNSRDAGWDRDVLARFPREQPQEAAPGQSSRDHILVPTTMYLLVDHPQPLGLGHPLSYTLIKNPNPQQFVAAYDVRSRVLSVPTMRLLGRRSIPAPWTASQSRHYTARPEDPRYRALADIIVRDVDSRFTSDDLARAYAIKRYLEREGFYTMKSTHSSTSDPTASFLFGSLRGYCVHFAHAAVFLLRSQGIAARVALGYAVQTNKRGGGSSVLIMSDRAHAWPEIHLEGIGWVTFDIYPERTDLPPPSMVDYDLEKLLGELARKDETAGLSPGGVPLNIPWGVLARGLLLLCGALLALAYLLKIFRRLRPLMYTAIKHDRQRARLAYIALLDRLSDVGLQRRRGETRERHAARLARIAPHLSPLTRVHLSLSLGSGSHCSRDDFTRLVHHVSQEIKTNVHPIKRVLGKINPVGWMLTR